MKRASVLLLASIVIFSVGCGASRESLPPAPLMLTLPDCPAPARPALPHIDAALPFDAPVNVAALLERDDLFRLHVEGLDASLACFRRLASPENAVSGSRLKLPDASLALRRNGSHKPPEAAAVAASSDVAASGEFTSPDMDAAKER